MPDVNDSKNQSRKNHWESVYSRPSEKTYSWFQQLPSESLAMIRATKLPTHGAIIDVGAGDSNLVDHLLALSFDDISVLDISDAALLSVQQRLGEDAARVQWLSTDITQFKPDKQYDLWHDRAVFHFLTRAEDREAYKEILKSALSIGGHLIMATFALNGPKRCSGLDTVQYDADSISKELGKQFSLQQTKAVLHKTPSGAEQTFNYYWFIYEEN